MKIIYWHVIKISERSALNLLKSSNVTFFFTLHGKKTEEKKATTGTFAINQYN